MINSTSNSNNKGKPIELFEVLWVKIDNSLDTTANSREVTPVHSHRTSSLSRAHTKPTNILMANSIMRSMASQVRQGTDQPTPTPRLRATEA
jgi:hypothetical protein